MTVSSFSGLSVRNTNPVVDANAFTDNDGTTVSKAEAHVVVGRVRKFVMDEGVAVGINIVGNFYDLPKSVIAQAIEDKAKESIDGVAFGDQIYLVLDKHTTTKNLEETLFHELYGHIGLKNLLGNDLERKMNELYQSIGEFSRKKIKFLFLLIAVFLFVPLSLGFENMCDEMKIDNLIWKRTPFHSESEKKPYPNHVMLTFAYDKEVSSRIVNAEE